MKNIGKIALSLSLVFSLSNAFDGIVAKANKWQMLSFKDDVNLSNIGDLRKDNFSIIWFWNNGEWRAFSKDQTIKNIISQMGYYDEIIKTNQAFWILPKKDMTITSSDPLYIPYPSTKGWHLTSANFIEEMANAAYQSQEPATKAIYLFRDNNWEYIKYKQGEWITSNNNKKIFPFANEGFWIYNSRDIDNSSRYYYGSDYRPKTEEPFSDKIFNIGETTTLTFDQNGTVTSNDERFNGGEWSGDSFNDRRIKFSITKGDKRYFFNGDRNYESTYPNGYQITLSLTQKFTTLSNGVEEITDENGSSSESGLLTYEDYNRSTLSQSVKDAFDELSDLFDNGNSDARSTLNSLETSLQSENSTQAKVALSIIDFIKVLDTDIVKNSFITNSENLDINSFFSNVVIPSPHDTIELATNISDLNQSAKELLQTLSNKLKEDAIRLEVVSNDKNFFIAYKDTRINYVDIKALRVAMLLLSYKLQYLSAYDLGSNEWLQKRVENGIEYEKATADPVGFLRSKTFFVNPNPSKLLNAKMLLESALRAYITLLEGKNYEQNGLVVTNSDISYRNALRDAKMALYNLESKQSSFDIVSDNIAYDCQPESPCYPTYKKERDTIDLNALFDTSTAITINDIGSFSYFDPSGGSYDANLSKINNSPTSTTGNEMQIDINNDYTYTQANHINSFFKKMLDSDGNLFEGVALLNKMFTN